MNKAGWIVRLEATKGPTLMLNAWYLDRDGQQEQVGWSAAALEKELMQAPVLEYVGKLGDPEFPKMGSAAQGHDVRLCRPDSCRCPCSACEHLCRHQRESVECKACGWLSDALIEASKPLVCPDCGTAQLVWITRRPPSRPKTNAFAEILGRPRGRPPGSKNRFPRSSESQWGMSGPPHYSQSYSQPYSQPQSDAPSPSAPPEQRRGPDDSELRGVVATMKHFADKYGPSVRLVLSGLSYLVPIVIMIAGKRAGLNSDAVLNKWADFVRTNPDRFDSNASLFRNAVAA
jgi:hypothetical protein